MRVTTGLGAPEHPSAAATPAAPNSQAARRAGTVRITLPLAYDVRPANPGRGSHEHIRGGSTNGYPGPAAPSEIGACPGRGVGSRPTTQPGRGRIHYHSSRVAR